MKNENDHSVIKIHVSRITIKISLKWYLNLTGRPLGLRKPLVVQLVKRLIRARVLIKLRLTQLGKPKTFSILQKQSKEVIRKERGFGTCQTLASWLRFFKLEARETFSGTTIFYFCSRFLKIIPLISACSWISTLSRNSAKVAGIFLKIFLKKFYSQSSGSTVFTHHSDQTTRGSPDENSGSVYTTPIHRSSDSIETKSSGMVTK